MEKVAFILGTSIALVLGPQHAAEAFMVTGKPSQGIVLSLPAEIDR